MVGLGRTRWVVVAALSPCAPAFAAAALPDPKKIAQSLIDSEAMQTAIPRRLDEPIPSWNLHLPRNLSEAILWALVILGVLAIAYALRNSLPAWDRTSRLAAEGEDEGGLGDGRSSLQDVRREAEDLARLGRFDEAMHVLLLRAVGELRDKLKLTIADSLTAREIERRAPLDDSGKSAFGRMVHAVEHVVFGREAADVGAYEACRGDFETFAASLIPGAAR